jgi:hypothetical protein
VIELRMVRHMLRTGALAAPLVVVPLWILGGPRAGLSGAIGLVMALGNLWLAGRIIGGVAERAPQLLVGAALAAFAVGLGLLTALAFALQSLAIVSFRVTGFVLIGAHLGLVLWEAARAFPVEPSRSSMRAGS